MTEPLSLSRIKDAVSYCVHCCQDGSILVGRQRLLEWREGLRAAIERAGSRPSAEVVSTTIGKCLTFAEIEGLLAAERERCAAVLDKMEAEARRKAKDYAGHEYERDHKQRARTAEVAASRIRNLPPQTEGGQL